MRSSLISMLLLVVAVIHLLPVAGLLGPEKLKALYQIDITSSDLDILMRHRAVLFGILGAFIGYAAFRPGLQPIAFVMAGISVVSFLVLCASAGQVNDALFKVVVADVIALGCLVVAIWLYYKAHQQL